MNLYSKLKSAMPGFIKIKIRLFFSTSKAPEWIKYNDGRPKVYIFLAGFYQNLGDMAITYAQKRFLQNCFPESDVITVPSTSTYYAIKTIKTFIKPNDIVTIIGGGNMSDMYVSLENARLHVVKSFPNNKIISFPQTMAFSETPYGRKRQKISRKVYSKHKNLKLFVREPFSLERIKKAFPDVKSGLCPDIVLSLNKFEPKCDRHGVLCCLRSDNEQLIQSNRREELIKAVNNRYSDVTFKDTVDISLEECTEAKYEQTLETFWDMLRHKEVVVTDRLHCMIFCAITGTPCVVMDNLNRKISGVYRAWLQNVDYIRLVEKNDARTVIRAVEEVRSVEVPQSIDLTKQFESLRRACMM